MPPLLLDDDEAVAIAVGLRTAAGASVTGIEETAMRALVKLEQVLPVAPAPARQRAAVGRRRRCRAAGPTVDPEALDGRSPARAATASACASATAAATASESRRLVEPH